MVDRQGVEAPRGAPPAGDPLAASPSDAWLGDDVVLTSVGVDIGSATTHVTFSRLRLRRKATQLSTAYALVERTGLGSSPIALTPYRPDGLIDADGVSAIVTDAYRAVELEPEQVDTGALILTGEAVKRANARPIGEQLAAAAGRFVSASAGPALEAIMAAHGSGSVALSTTVAGDVLNVDIGGGSTKFALIRDGEVVEVAALEVGGRLIAERDGTIIRRETAADPILGALGITLAEGGDVTRIDRWRIGRAMADVVVDTIQGRALAAPFDALWITPPLVLTRPPAVLTISGGVGEYVHDAGGLDLGDLGLPFAEGLRHAIESGVLPPLRVSGESAIRATVMGASQFTVQVSGSTIHVGDGMSLPIHDIPVVRPPGVASELAARPGVLRAAIDLLDLHVDGQPLAIAIAWDGPPEYGRLRRLGDWLLAEVAPRSTTTPVVLLFDADVAYLMGRLLVEELGWAGPLVAIDSIEVRQFDFLDIGEVLEPQGVVPVVVKSLVFANEGHPEGGPTG